MPGHGATWRSTHLPFRTELATPHWTVNLTVSPRWSAGLTLASHWTVDIVAAAYWTAVLAAVSHCTVDVSSAPRSGVQAETGAEV
jgi:hypothetical protein